MVAKDARPFIPWHLRERGGSARVSGARELREQADAAEHRVEVARLVEIHGQYGDLRGRFAGHHELQRREPLIWRHAPKPHRLESRVRLLAGLAGCEPNLGPRAPVDAERGLPFGAAEVRKPVEERRCGGIRTLPVWWHEGREAGAEHEEVE